MKQKTRYYLRLDKTITDNAIDMILLLSIEHELTVLSNSSLDIDNVSKALNERILKYKISDAIAKQAIGRILYADAGNKINQEGLEFNFEQLWVDPVPNSISIRLYISESKKVIELYGTLNFEQDLLASLTIDGLQNELDLLTDKISDIQSIRLDASHSENDNSIITKPLRIAQQLMYDHDAFSQLLNMNILSVGEGSVVVEMPIDASMLNGFGICHGGVMFSLADSALAFASNSHGRKAVSIETSISNVKAVGQGDILVATAKEISLSHKLGIYLVDIHNQHEELVATFKGTVYRKSEEWNLD